MQNFQASNFSSVASVPAVPADCGRARNEDDWRNAGLADLAELYARGEVAQEWATRTFWSRFPHAVGDPAAVTAVFVAEGILPPEVTEKSLDGEKLVFSPRSLESGLSRGTVKAERGNDGILRIYWKGLLLDYGPAVFWIRLSNCARKAQDKAAKTEGKDAGTSRKESKNEREWRERAEKAEAAIKAKDALAAEAAQQAAEFTARVRQLVHQLVDASQAAPGRDGDYNGAAMALLNLLP